MEKLSFVLCHAAINHTPETKILKDFHSWDQNFEEFKMHIRTWTYQYDEQMQTDQ